MMGNDLIEHIDQLHTTAGGLERIRRGLGLTEDPLKWCRRQIMDRDARMERKGKNWYVTVSGAVITVHAGSYTIITAHKKT